MPDPAPRPAGRRPWYRRWQWELLLLLYAAYDGSRLLVEGEQTRARRHGEALLRAERHLRLDPERWLNARFTRHALLGIPADYLYATLHYAVTPAVLVWLWRTHRRRYRFARTWLGLTTLLGVLGFLLFPTEPPRLLPAAWGFHDTMAQHAALGWWGGSGGAPRGLGAMTNEYAAMPSLHVAWALWSGLLLARWARRRWVRVLGALYPPVIALVVMGTGNHYLSDCLAGTGVTALGGLAAAALLRGRSHPDRPLPAPEPPVTRAEPEPAGR